MIRETMINIGNAIWGNVPASENTINIVFGILLVSAIITATGLTYIMENVTRPYRLPVLLVGCVVFGLGISTEMLIPVLHNAQFNECENREKTVNVEGVTFTVPITYCRNRSHLQDNWSEWAVDIDQTKMYSHINH